jgi:hypothetical protein
VPDLAVQHYESVIYWIRPGQAPRVYEQAVVFIDQLPSTTSTPFRPPITGQPTLASVEEDE